MVSINGVSNVPMDINSGNGSVDENKPSGTVVGSLSTIYSNTGEAFTCSLEKGYFCYARFLSILR